jgi:hypothetical protein
MRLLYRVFIGMLLAALLLLPLARFYRSAIGETAAKGDFGRICAWLNKNTAPGSIVMSNWTHRIAWYADRGAVMLPDARREDILDLCAHYRVDYIVCIDTEAQNLGFDTRPISEQPALQIVRQKTFGRTSIYRVLYGAAMPGNMATGGHT